MPSTQPRKILIATRNRGKAREFGMLFGEGWITETLNDLPNAPDIVEDGATFEENALKKALTISRIYPDGYVLADDSGLEVDALHGEPGVRSARFAGEEASDAMNNEKLLDALKLQPDVGRTAKFRCVLVLAKGGEVVAKVEGICRGSIAKKPEGDEGFGYDPVFMPENSTQTFAQMKPERKNRISHRALAMERLSSAIRKL